MDKNFHLVLYRKYRPQMFSEIVGQNHITEPLKKAVCSNKISHSYLFSGPKGTGKTSVGRILAKAVNFVNEKKILSLKNISADKTATITAVLNKTGEPCNKCSSCEEITHGNHIDLIEIDAASNRGIDEVRALKEAVRLNPLKSKYKVYIIDEVHMMTKDAFNALLKTVEEPPPFVIFILATTEREKIPETIASRCQHFTFKKMTDELVRLSLKTVAEKENIKIGEDALNLISILADGSLRDAHAKLEQVADFEQREIKDDYAREFFGAPPETLVKEFIEAAFSENGEKLAETARIVSN